VDSIFDDEDYMTWILASQTRNAIRKLRQRELAEYGISPRQAGILLLSKAMEGEVTPYKFAKWEVIEHHTASEVVSRMEKKGLIKRLSVPGTPKSVRLELTEKGREIAEHAGKAETFHKIFSCLSEKERKEYKSILAKLRRQALRELGMKQESHFFPPY